MLRLNPISFRIKIVFLTVGICFVGSAVICKQRSQAFAQSVDSSTPRSSVTATIGRVNGKIAFSSNRGGRGNLGIWTINPDGSNATNVSDVSFGASTSYLYDTTPKWSPDGTKLAFSSIGRPVQGYFSIFIMNPDGSDVREVAVDSSNLKDAAEMGGFNWSPDGTKFVFDAGAYISIPEERLTSNIFIADVDGKNVVRLTNDHEVMNGGATWSPDGKMIAFVSRDGAASAIQVMKPDGSNRQTIAVGSGPTWSPDSSRILFVGPTQYYNCPKYNACQQLYTISPDGSGLTQLTHYEATYAVYSAPKYSPDGTKIVFERSRNTYQYNATEIFVMDADGNNQTNISSRASGSYVIDSEPDWQPLSAATTGPPPSVLGIGAGVYVGKCDSTKVEVTITRSGNLDQSVSCDYWVGRDNVGSTASLVFAVGETSKTIQVSGICDVLYPTKVSLFNNSGNATFVGAMKNATVVFVGDNANRIDNPAFFVAQHYKDFLNREPDPLGSDYWTNNIASCGADLFGRDCQKLRRTDTSASFFLSIEFQQTGYLVYRTYKAGYGNLPGAPVPLRFNEFLPDTQQIGRNVIVGEGDWQQQLETNKQNFMLEFVQRPRFVTAYPTILMPIQFVDALFTTAGVTPTLDERLSLMSEFGGAVNSTDINARARVLRRVAENPALGQQEFNRAFVLMQYFGYLRRNPNEGPDTDYSGYMFWLNKLNSFNGDYQKAEMVKAFINSDEYRKRFGP